MPRLFIFAVLSLVASSGCAPCVGVDVATAADGTPSRKVSTYLSSPVEITLVDRGGQLFLDLRYSVDGGGDAVGDDKAVAVVTFADGYTERLEAIAPPYAGLDTDSETGALLGTSYRARFVLTPTLAQHLTTTPIVTVVAGTPARTWTFESKPSWANELVTKSRCIIPPAACQQPGPPRPQTASR